MEDIHEQIAELKKRAESEKALRDEENKKVTEYKKKRNDLLDKITALRVEVAKLESNLAKASDEFTGSVTELRKEYKELDWKYQTGVTSHAKEKEIVKSLQEMEKKLAVADDIQTRHIKLKQMLRDIKKLKIESDHNHELVKKHATESEKHHQNMLKSYELLNKLETKAKEQRVHTFTKPIRQFVQKISHRPDDKLRVKAEQVLADFKKGKKVSLQDLALLEKYDLY